MIDNAILLSLAPAELPIPRPLRFDGAGLEVPLARFALKDRDILRHIYARVDGLALKWRAMGPDVDWDALGRCVMDLAQEGLIDQAQALGWATQAAGLDSPETGKAIHDVRGGGLTVLLGASELLSLLPASQKLIQTCVASARDHAKIMRCLLPDLDPAGRATDEATKAHGVGHFVDKWHRACLRGPSGMVSVTVHCEFQGDVSARCLETAAIDRVLYNLVNNAVRFAVGGEIELAVLPVGSHLTRWVVGNRVTATEATFLAGMDLKALYAGGVTRGGNGIGLANCAEVVAECFGLRDATAAAQGGYVGSALQDDTFLAWFHWPSHNLPGSLTNSSRAISTPAVGRTSLAATD